MTQTLEDLRKVNNETEHTRKFYLECGYKVRSDYDGLLTMTLQVWPFISVVIDRSKGYVTDTIYPKDDE